MPNYKSTRNQWDKLFDTELGGTSNSILYTPTIALNMATKYRRIIVQVTGTPTAALELQMKLNGQTNYDHNYLLADTTTVSAALVTDATTFPLIPNTLIDGAAVHCSAQAEIIMLTDGSSNDWLQIHSRGQTAHEGSVTQAGSAQTAASTITSIEILVSTSTMQAGTRVTIFGELQ